MSILKLKVLYLSDQPIFKDFEIGIDNSLEAFHSAIVDSFGFDGSQMASFYELDDLLNSTSEIALTDLGIEKDAKTMSEVVLGDVIIQAEDQLEYTYDYLMEFKFHIECLSVVEGDASLSAKVVGELGTIEFQQKEQLDGSNAEGILMDAILGDEFSDDLDEEDDYLESDQFESLDDYEEFL